MRVSGRSTSMRRRGSSSAPAQVMPTMSPLDMSRQLLFSPLQFLSRRMPTLQCQPRPFGRADALSSVTRARFPYMLGAEMRASLMDGYFFAFTEGVCSCESFDARSSADFEAQKKRFSEKRSA